MAKSNMLNKIESENFFQSKSRGVSLLEALIYVGIFAVVAGGLIGILYGSLSVTSREQAANEVDENLRQAISIIGEKVRNSDIVQSATSSTLVLKMATTSSGGFSTTTFSVSDNMLYLTENSANPVPVLSNNVKIDSLEFTKVEMAGAKDGVRVNMVLSYNSDKSSLSFSKSILSTINRAVAITFNEHVLPGVDNAYDVGASDNLRWKDAYFSGDLNVAGSVTSTQLCLSDGCYNAWSDIGLWTATSGGIYYNGGRIGVGTNNPNRRLDIEYESNSGSYTNLPTISVSNQNVSTSSSDYSFSALEVAGNNNTLRGSFLADGSGLYNSGTPALYIRTDTSHPILFGTGLSEKMRITTDGNVGIGTTTPSALLHLYGSAPVLFSEYSGGAKNNFSASANYGFVGTKTDHQLRFTVNDSVKMLIDNSSNNYNVGIASTTPATTLGVGGNITLSGTVIPDNACGIAGTLLNFGDDTITSGGAFPFGGYAQGPGMICPGKILAISGRCQAVDASNHVALEVEINGVSQSCDTNEIISSNTSYITSGCNVSFSAGDAIGCYAKTETGSVNNCTCSISVRFD